MTVIDEDEDDTFVNVVLNVQEGYVGAGSGEHEHG